MRKSHASEPPGVAQLRQVAPRQTERLSYRVLGAIGVSKHRADVAGHRRDAGAVERRECVAVALLRTTDEPLDRILAEGLLRSDNRADGARHR